MPAHGNLHEWAQKIHIKTGSKKLRMNTCSENLPESRFIIIYMNGLRKVSWIPAKKLFTLMPTERSFPWVTAQKMLHKYASPGNYHERRFIGNFHEYVLRSSTWIPRPEMVHMKKFYTHTCRLREMSYEYKIKKSFTRMPV